MMIHDQYTSKVSDDKTHDFTHHDVAWAKLVAVDSLPLPLLWSAQVVRQKTMDLFVAQILTLPRGTLRKEEIRRHVYPMLQDRLARKCSASSTIAQCHLYIAFLEGFKAKMVVYL